MTSCERRPICATQLANNLQSFCKLHIFFSRGNTHSISYNLQPKQKTSPIPSPCHSTAIYSLSKSHSDCIAHAPPIRTTDAMSRASLIQASRLASRALQRSAAPRAAFRLLPVLLTHTAVPSTHRTLSLSAPFRKGIMPDTESPAKEPPASPEPTYGAIELSEAEYHDLADEYLEGVLTQFEALQDTREDIDIEFSVCSSLCPQVQTF